MGYTLEIEVPLHPTDSNRILGVNKFAKHSVFKRVKADIAHLVHGKAPEAPLERFKVSVTRHGSRCLDWDNFVASLKPFLDGLKISGVIKDDSWHFIKQINTEQKISTERKLVIRVIEVVSEELT